MIPMLHMISITAHLQAMILCLVTLLVIICVIVSVHYM